jgi:hypothetical protein
MRIAAIAAILLVATPLSAHAQRIGAASPRGRPYNHGPIGVGVQAGVPLGVTAKLWLGGVASIDVAAGVGAGADPHVHADLIWEAGELYRGQQYLERFYIGIGGRFEAEDDDDGWRGRPTDDEEEPDTDAGPRILYGIEHRFRSYSDLEIFLEFALGYDLVDETHTTIDGALGARWYF